MPRLMYDEPLSLYGLVRDLFFAASVTCLLYALHRIGHGLQLGGRVEAYDALEMAYTPEEREQLIHRIKHESMRY